MSDGLKQEVDKLKRQVRALEDELTGLSQIKNQIGRCMTFFGNVRNVVADSGYMI